MQRIDGRQITVILTEEQLATIEKIRKRHELTQAEAVRNMVEVGTTVYRDMERTGIIKIAELVEKTEKLLREKRQPRLI